MKNKMTNPINKRVYPRLPTMLKVEYSKGGEVYYDYSTNISKGGLFLHSSHFVDTGHRLHIRLRLPGEQRPIHAIGLVMWTDKGGQASPNLPGVGIRFQHITQEHRDQLEHFLEQFVN